MIVPSLLSAKIWDPSEGRDPPQEGAEVSEDAANLHRETV